MNGKMIKDKAHLGRTDLDDAVMNRKSNNGRADLSMRYDAAKVDIWYCEVVLFVLMVGYLPFYDQKMYRFLLP